MTETTPLLQEADATAPSRRAARTARGEGEAYWFFGGLTIVRSPQGARPIVIETTMQPGSAAPLHLHTGLDDNLYLLAGRLAVRSGEETFVVQAGDYVSEPAGVPQALTVLGDTPAVLLQIHATDDFLTLVRQAGTPARDRTRPPDGPPDYEALYRIAAATGTPVLGPPMTADEVAAIVRMAEG